MEVDLDRARNGDREEMARLVDQHYDAVYRFCARRLGPDHAQDAAQETFLTVQKRIGSFRGDSGLGTWLFGIAHNHCRNIARRRRIEPMGDWWDSSQVAGSGSRDANAPGPEAQTCDPADVLIDRQVLRDALAALSPDHREVVLLHEVEGLSYREAAEVIGVPEGTVKSRLHHAFLNLRRAVLGPDEVTA
jgi:RNA polymerase sigma-70 factor (ECF subfamily)